MSRVVLLVATLVAVSGCGDGPVTPPNNSPPVAPPPPVVASILVSGSMTPEYQSIRVKRDGQAVTDAQVTVNGTPIKYCCADLYTGYLPAVAPAGSTLNLKVVTGGVTFEGSGEVIATPAITAPAEGSTFASTAPINLTWSSPTDPDKFEVCLNCWANALEGAIYGAAGSTRQFNISPGALVDYGGGTIVAVYAFKYDFLKPASSPSGTSNVLFVAKSPDAHINIQY